MKFSVLQSEIAGSQDINMRRKQKLAFSVEILKTIILFQNKGLKKLIVYLLENGDRQSIKHHNLFKLKKLIPLIC